MYEEDKKAQIVWEKMRQRCAHTAMPSSSSGGDSSGAGGSSGSGGGRSSGGPSMTRIKFVWRIAGEFLVSMKEKAPEQLKRVNGEP